MSIFAEATARIAARQGGATDPTRVARLGGHPGRSDSCGTGVDSAGLQGMIPATSRRGIEVVELAVSGFVSSLTIAALLAHSLVGCCWHHAHRCRQRVRHATVADSRVADHRHDTPEAGRFGPRDPCERENHGKRRCESGRCVFVLERPGPRPATPVELSCGLPAFVSMAGRGASTYAMPEASMPPPDGSRLPVRTHLLLQVLLI